MADASAEPGPSKQDEELDISSASSSSVLDREVPLSSHIVRAQPDADTSGSPAAAAAVDASAADTPAEETPAIAPVVPATNGILKAPTLPAAVSPAPAVRAVPKAQAALPGAAANHTMTDAEARQRMALENMRLQKWRDMLANWPTWVTKKQSYLKERCRKGIPDAFRCVVWPMLIQSDQRHAANKDLYAQLLTAPVPPDQESVMGEITRDITRTFPKMQLFREREGVGQAALFRVLRAYALFNPQVGYCQGMSFITALLLSYLTEEQAFWMLLTLCESEPHRLADIFAPGLPLVQLLQFQLEQLVEQHLPKLSAHFTKHGISPTMFSAQWLLTIFTYSFSFSVTCRIWDSFLLEGWKVVFRFALAVLAHHEQTLLKKDMEGILMFMHVIHEGLEADSLVDAAFRIKLKRKHLLQLRKVYEQKNGPTVSPVKRMRSFKSRKADIMQSIASEGGGAAAGAGGVDAFSSGEGGDSASDGGEVLSATGDNAGAGAFQGAHSDTAAVGSRAAAEAHDPGHAPSRKHSNVADLDAVLVPGSPSVAAYTRRASREAAAAGAAPGQANPPSPPLRGNDAPSHRRRASARSLLARAVPDTLDPVTSTAAPQQ